MATTQELGAAFTAAREAHEAKRSERSKYINGRVDAERIRAGHKAELIYDSDIKALRAAADAAYTAHRDALDADARAGVGAIITPGTLLYAWEYPRRTFGRRDEVLQMRKTERSARYVALTKDTVLPSNKVYGLPRLGDFFLQVVKKDGSAGVAIVPYSDWGVYFPDGVDPNTLPKNEWNQPISPLLKPVARATIVLE